MRCTCCNRNLNDSESTAKHPETLEYLDMCMKCLKDTGITPLLNTTHNPEENVNEIEINWFGDNPEITYEEFCNTRDSAR